MPVLETVILNSGALKIHLMTYHEYFPKLQYESIYTEGEGLSEQGSQIVERRRSTGDTNISLSGSTFVDYKLMLKNSTIQSIMYDSFKQLVNYISVKLVNELSDEKIHDLSILFQEEYYNALYKYTVSFKINYFLAIAMKLFDTSDIEVYKKFSSMFNNIPVKIKCQILLIADILANTTIDKDIKVYRGMKDRAESLFDAKNVNANINRTRAQKEFVKVYPSIYNMLLEPGSKKTVNMFMSTSVLPEHARKFIQKEGKCCLVEINIPAGSEGLFISGFSAFKDEFEVVLPFKSQFTVNREHNPADGITKMTYLGISKETKKKSTLNLYDTYFLITCQMMKNIPSEYNSRINELFMNLVI